MSPSEPLWTCLLFPSLAGDRLTAQGPDGATVVVDSTAVRRDVLACNAAALDAGVQPGLPLKSAYALVPDLRIEEHDPEARAAQLDGLALWALRYSSWVTLRPPDCILLEVASSLRLFDGLAALLARLRRGAAAQGLTLRLGTAPTPAAATLLARAGRTEPVFELSALAAALQPVPIEHLSFDAFVLRGLRQSGIRTVGQLQRVPPAALTRRFGHRCTDLLYRLDGRLPDPCPACTIPERFRQEISLPLEAPDVAALSFSLNRLLNALGGFLRHRDCGARALAIRLRHERHVATTVPLRFLDPTADVRHLLRVAGERLAATELAAPVIAVGLEAEETAPMGRHERDLLSDPRDRGQTIGQVVETLMARIGRERLYLAMPSEDHRPEKAWVQAVLDTRRTDIRWPARPLWLLSAPRPAHAALTLCTPPERIENGWWDTPDVRRDYFVARDDAGSYYWAYRSRRDPDTLFVHGLFG